MKNFLEIYWSVLRSSLLHSLRPDVDLETYDLSIWFVNRSELQVGYRRPRSRHSRGLFMVNQ
jgi:hypothetical protein